MIKKLYDIVCQNHNIDLIALAHTIFDQPIIIKHVMARQNYASHKGSIHNVRANAFKDSILIDVSVIYEYAKTTNFDKLYFDILISLELENIRVSSKGSKSGADQYRSFFEINPKEIMQQFYRYKLELA